jgi:hypothetical protein
MITALSVISQAFDGHAMVSRAQALSQMAPERRMATLLAFARTVEATATDDALSIFDLLLDDLFKGAARTGKKRRLDTLRDLDSAARVLRDVARVVRDPQCRDAAVRLTVTATHDDATIDAAIAVIDTLARSPNDHYQQEILDQYPTVRRFLPTLLRTLRFGGIAGARPLREALDFLTALEGPRPPAVDDAPLTAIPNAWRDRVRGPGPGDPVDRKAYTCAVLERTQVVLRRHDLFVAPSEKWTDLRTGLLQGGVWEAARSRVCRALDHALDPAVELVAMNVN